jgi:hypothetical protein
MPVAVFNVHVVSGNSDWTAFSAVDVFILSFILSITGEALRKKPDHAAAERLAPGFHAGGDTFEAKVGSYAQDC